MNTQYMQIHIHTYIYSHIHSFHTSTHQLFRQRSGVVLWCSYSWAFGLLQCLQIREYTLSLAEDILGVWSLVDHTRGCGRDEQAPFEWQKRPGWTRVSYFSSLLLAYHVDCLFFFERLEDEDIDTYKLMKEANMPLKDLLGQYIGAKQLLGKGDSWVDRWCIQCGRPVEEIAL